MNTYNVHYLENGKPVKKEVLADDIFQLASKLDSEILYREQLQSVYKIEKKMTIEDALQAIVNEDTVLSAAAQIALNDRTRRSEFADNFTQQYNEPGGAEQLVKVYGQLVVDVLIFYNV